MPRKQAANKNDDDVRTVVEALRSAYGTTHARAEISVKRRSHSIRIRIVDPDFQGLSLGARDDLLSTILETLSADIQSQISMLLLLTPEEANSDLLNLEFNNPMRPGF